MPKGYVYMINRSVDETVYCLCEQNLYHCNGRITMIDFIHFGTFVFCVLVLYILSIICYGLIRFGIVSSVVHHLKMINSVNSPVACMSMSVCRA